MGALALAVEPRAVAAAAGDQFVEAYFAIQQGDAAERTGNPAQAEDQFISAMRTLNQIKAQAPDWNPQIVDYRLTYCASHLARLRDQRGAAPAKAAPSPVSENVKESPQPKREPAEATRAPVAFVAPVDLPALLNQGRAAFAEGDLETAQGILRQAVRLAPADSAAKALLGATYFRRGKLDDAFDELTGAVALNPRNAEAHNYLGVTLTERGWPAAAETEMRRAIELNPKYVDAHFNLAVLYARGPTPRMDRARDHYEKSLADGGTRDPQLEALLGIKK